ncbi:DNA-packaging protein [Savagea sp. SN6]|uniref:DNA-packaging protein n=1 Tax=Savagea serpentis TaxID=2785297 RepID=A0A8J7KDM6_9BACL|nr:head-tail connector protein [Savagea serpentis]MBF4500231.1 DNA-packaging protein [Savagea serpentis]
MALLDKCKIALRVSADVFDDEIKMLIEAGKLDLEESGINVDLDDELIETAVIFFVKSSFGYDNKDSEKQLRAYERIKRKLALSSRWAL